MAERIASYLEIIPAPLREGVTRHWESFEAAAAQRSLTLPEAPEFYTELVTAWAGSGYVATQCARSPELLLDLFESGDLHRSYEQAEYASRLSERLSGVTTDVQLAEVLRRFRSREMVRVAWRDLTGHAELKEVTHDLSAIADACIDQALTRLYDWHVEQWGTPCSADGGPQRMVVLGMGKLGARELNFSSDIDLIFAYPEDGQTQGARRSIDNREFFVRLGQRLIAALDKPTDQGFVFRVDMRLRPFGSSSALAASFDAMETYYQVHGREWERYAMIKARVVAGDKEAGERLLTMLKPFVYRRYVDFGAFESLREMKAMIEREVRRKGMQENVKLGPGGIREVEFIGQAFQLIRGGREPTLQQRPILTILEALKGFQLLPDYVVAELAQAYVFLRNVEHRLQMAADQQTHSLPVDETGRLRLAWSMGFSDWVNFERALRRRMASVHGHFEQVFAAPQAERGEETQARADFDGFWQGSLDAESVHELLAKSGFEDPDEADRLVERLREGHSYRALSAQGRSRLDRLMPLLLGAVAGSRHPDRTLKRVLMLIESVGRRTAYLALLVENPMALSQLVKLCDASSWIATLLARHPLLLDELLDPRTLYAPPRRRELENELRQRMLRIPVDDIEQQMEVLRQFKQTNLLRVAAADVMEAVPLMVVSDHLTELAEVIVEQCVDIAWRHLVERHGRPWCGDDRVCDIGFAVVAYGKLGGIELGYGSDLDLVFMYSTDSEGRTTDGDKPVDNAVFYARLAQRIIHILNTRTPAGKLYEVDTRLRPSGASGLLVTGLEGFADYQRKQAWTWEHQALVRARAVSGDVGIVKGFDAIRREVLGRERDREVLRKEVREMRERMRASLGKGGAGEFDLKQSPGGIADIEFMVQYGVLAWAHEFPHLLDFTDNIRLLEGLARDGILSEDDAALLGDAYRAYRARAHRLTLQEQPAVVSDGEFRHFRDGVSRIWGALMGS